MIVEYCTFDLSITFIVLYIVKAHCSIRDTGDS